MSSTTKLALRFAGSFVLVLVVAGGAVYAWAGAKSSSLLARTFETHRADFPVPFPLTESELAALDPASDPAKAALERAVARGEHLVRSRYACIECHGVDFGGGTMIADPAMGRLLGPNITTGRGSPTHGYTASDWDRIVRHGVKPDGRPAVMPAQDFFAMSDRELSDIVAYIQAQDPVDNTRPAVTLGPLGKVLIALGEFPLPATQRAEHTAAHVVEPPAATDQLAFGKHLAQTCVGCHRADLSGGPIVGGDPSWVPAANLTMHAEGLSGWKYKDFKRVLRSGKRPDGTDVRAPMTMLLPYGKQMKDEELRAMWAYLESLPPRPKNR